jgi:hypothetical protein
MDDLTAQITQFLSSEDGMNQVRAVAEALGMGDRVPSGTGGGVGSAPASAPTVQNSGGASNGQGLDMGTLMLLQRAVAAFSEDDKNTELLRALKPHFSPARAKKVDDAVRILQLIRLLPLVRESGILQRGREP